MKKKFKLLSDKYYAAYQKRLVRGFNAKATKILKSKTGAPDIADYFEYCASESAVHSSNIEGNPVTMDEYWKHRKFKLHTGAKKIKEIKELVSAYYFAKENDLTLSNMLKAHDILSRSFIIKKYRGTVRDQQVGVYDKGFLIYLAIEPEHAAKEIENLFHDINILLHDAMPVSRALYYASMIHLMFAKIHPFIDGNGRTARLLEKWFLAEKFGEDAWFIKSELFYHVNIKDYYKNLRIGPNYYEINLDKCLPFLLMLPESLEE